MTVVSPAVGGGTSDQRDALAGGWEGQSLSQRDVNKGADVEHRAS